MSARIAIVGGGASGLLAACALAAQGERPVVLEKQDRVGRKLLATGNGRCNLSHLGASPKDYHGSIAAVKRVLSAWPPERTLAFFSEALGLRWVVDGEGRCYPKSHQAAGVLDLLRLYLAERGVEVRAGGAVTAIRPAKEGFRIAVEGVEGLPARCVLVSCGGPAAPKLGGCRDGARLLEALGHASRPFLPALAPLNAPAEKVRALKGQRLEGEIALYAGGARVCAQRGEILFSDSGVSGIAAMNLARPVREALGRGEACEVSISALEEPAAEVEAALGALTARFPARALEDLLTGWVPKRYGQALLREAGLLPMSRPASSLGAAGIRRLAVLLTDWRLPVSGTGGMDAAQVSSGGVRLEDFDWDTMESRIRPGLFAAGEVLDVDGDCGGYNLQWAWSSALCAASGILRRLHDRGGRA